MLDFDDQSSVPATVEMLFEQNDRGGIPFCLTMPTSMFRQLVPSIEQMTMHRKSRSGRKSLVNAMLTSAVLARQVRGCGAVSFTP